MQTQQYFGSLRHKQHTLVRPKGKAAYRKCLERLLSLSMALWGFEEVPKVSEAMQRLAPHHSESPCRKQTLPDKWGKEEGKVSRISKALAAGSESSQVKKGSDRERGGEQTVREAVVYIPPYIQNVFRRPHQLAALSLRSHLLSQQGQGRHRITTVKK